MTDRPAGETDAPAMEPDTEHTAEHDAEHDGGAGRGAIVALVVLALLVIGGLWLTRVLGGAASVQDCLASGRTNCAPIRPGG